MKIVVTASGPSPDSPVDPRFGRAPYFVLYDDGEYRVVENPASQAWGGAGIQAAQQVVSLGAKVVITGNVGPNAAQALRSAGIQVYMGTGTVREAVERYLRGELRRIL